MDEMDISTFSPSRTGSVFWKNFLIRINLAGWKNISEFFTYVLHYEFYRSDELDDLDENLDTFVNVGDYFWNTFHGIYEKQTISHVFLGKENDCKNFDFNRLQVMKPFIKNLEYGASIGKTKKWFIWIKIPRMDNTTTIFSKLNNYHFTQSDFDIYPECKSIMRQLEIYDVNNLYSHKDFIYDSVNSKCFTYWYISRYEPEIIESFYKKYKSNSSGKFLYLHKYKTWILNNEFINRDLTERFLSETPYITTKWETIDFFIFNKVREKTLIRILKRFVYENYDVIKHTLYNPVNGIMMKLLKNDFDKLSTNAICNTIK